MRRGDAAGGGVVVGAEVRGDDAPAALGDQPRQRDAAVGGEDRLRRLDHQLELQRSPARGRASTRRRRTPTRAPSTCSGAVIFGSVTTKFGGSVPPVCSSSARQEEIEGPEAAALQLVAERLDPDADRRRQRAGLRCPRRPRRPPLRVLVLLGVGAVAEAVLEVDPEILDRLARQLVDDARVDARARASASRPERRGERRRVGRVLLQRAQRDRAELLRRVGLEQMRAAVDDVHRLPRGGVAGELLRDARRSPCRAGRRIAASDLSGIVVSGMAPAV